MKLLESLLKYIIKGIVYSLAFAALGVGFSFIKAWSYLKGAYIFVLGGGLLTLVVSVVLLIGTPQMRKDMHFDKDTVKKPNRGAEGIGPALMGLVMIVIGFWLEAFMHK